MCFWKPFTTLESATKWQKTRKRTAVFDGNNLAHWFDEICGERRERAFPKLDIQYFTTKVNFDSI